MRIRMAGAMVLMVLMVMLAGCGGSGEQAADGLPPPAIGGEALEIGPMIVQTEKTAGFKAANIFSDWDCSFVALYGAQINYLASTAMLDRVVFASNRAGAFNIYVVNLDGRGTSLVQLTNNNAGERWPRWSPDGSKIVFQRKWPSQNTIICTMNADGTGTTALTSGANRNYYPDWSPDGGRIACSNFSGISWDINTIYADGTAQTNITGSNTSDESYPSWSLDGTTVAFSTTVYGGWEIATVNAYGGTWTRLTNDPHNNLAPAYSPVAARIAYASQRHGVYDVFTMTGTGANQENLSANSANDVEARWSSDGSLIAFTSDRAGNRDVWIQEVNAPYRQWQVTKHGAVDDAPDLGSPTVQTERVLIGPNGSDRGGTDPLYPSAPAVIVAFNEYGYRNLVRIGVATAHLASIQIKPFENAGWDLSGVEVSATNIPNLRQDAGWGKLPTVWDFTALNPGMVLLYFHGRTGKLAAAVPVKDVVYPSDAGSAKPAYTSSVQSDSLLLTGDFPAVFDAEGNNLAPGGAGGVRIGKDGQVRAVN